MKLGILAIACALAAAPATWTGTWVLNVQKSTFGEILFPGAPEGFKVVSQTLTISATAREIRLSGDTVYSDRDGSHTAHDDGTLLLDGTETKMGPGSFTFKGIDDSSFQILSKLNDVTEVSKFKFSSDGKSLTETKTQTAPDRKTSTTVLQFSRK